MKPSLKNLKKSPDCMLWFSWGFLTTSHLQEEQHGRRKQPRRLRVCQGPSYLSAGQDGVGDTLDLLPRDKEEVLRCIRQWQPWLQ